MNTVHHAPRRRRRDPAGNRARMLAAARARIEEVGFDALTLRDVARGAGVALGTVALHFDDKTQILHEAFFVDLAATWQAARSLAAEGDLVADLAAIAAAFYAYYARRPKLSRTLLRESLFAEPPWRERFVGQIAEVSARVKDLAAAARARGELAADVDLDVLAASFLSFYYFALLAAVQGGHPAPLRLFTAMLRQHIDASSPSTKGGPS